jgi:hypothetical protein
MGKRWTAFGLCIASLALGATPGCGGEAAEAGKSRAETYQRNNPREGMGAPGTDSSPPPRDMPGSGRGSATPRGK